MTKINLTPMRTPQNEIKASPTGSGSDKWLYNIGQRLFDNPNDPSIGRAERELYFQGMNVENDHDEISARLVFGNPLSDDDHAINEKRKQYIHLGREIARTVSAMHSPAMEKNEEELLQIAREKIKDLETLLKDPSAMEHSFTFFIDFLASDERRAFGNNEVWYYADGLNHKIDRDLDLIDSEQKQRYEEKSVPVGENIRV